MLFSQESLVMLRDQIVPSSGGVQFALSAVLVGVLMISTKSSFSVLSNELIAEKKFRELPPLYKMIYAILRRSCQQIFQN